MNFIHSSILVFVSAIIGALLPKVIKNSQNMFDMFLPFSGAFLLSLSFLHLLPDTIEQMGHKSGLFVLIGFVLQLLLQKYSHGVEHGHGSTENHKHHFTFSLFLGLGIHAFIEGVPMGNPLNTSHNTFNLTLGVIIHKLPETFTLTILLLSSHLSKFKYWLYILLFSIITPMASILTYLFGTQNIIDSSFIPYIVAIAIGSFILITTTIFFESEGNKHQLSKTKIISLISGLTVAILLEFVLE